MGGAGNPVLISTNSKFQLFNPIHVSEARPELYSKGSLQKICDAAREESGHCLVPCRSGQFLCYSMTLKQTKSVSGLVKEVKIYFCTLTGRSAFLFSIVMPC